MSDRAEAAGPVFWGDADGTEALQRYRTLVNTIDDGIFQLDDGGRFVAVNDIIVEMTGYARGELLGEHISVLLDDADTSAIEREVERLRAEPTERSELLDLTVQTATGERVRCELRVNLLKAGDSVRGTVGVVRDLTERNRSEQGGGEREQEPEVWSTAMEQSVDGMAILDESAEYVFVNQAHAEMYGYDDPAALLGETWRLCYDDAEIERLEAEVMPALSAEGSWRGEVTGTHKDGSTFPQELSLTMLDDGRYVCVVRDITDQAKRERDLHETREQLAVAIEAASVGSWTWDIQTDTVTADKYLAESYGMESEEVAAGAPMAEFYEPIHEDDEEETWNQLEQAVEETGELDVEYRIRDADGELMWVEARGEVEYDEGEPVRMHGAVSDITERKRREQLLVKQKELLERIASGAPLEECLSALCDAVSRLNPGVRATILLADDERDAFERSIAPDFPPLWDEELEGAPINDLMIGTCGTAVFRGEPITCEDVANDERWSEDWREACVDHGVLAGHSEPILDADGDPEGSFMLCFDEPREPNEWEQRLADFGTHVADIALERDRSRQALQENEERLRLATEAAEMGVWELDLQTEDSPDHSPQHDEIFGYEEPPEDWSLDRFLDHVHADDHERVAQSFEDAFETGEWGFECRIVRADGEQRWITAQGEFYYDDGEPTRAVGTVQDITEQKKQEHQLRDAKSRLEAATEAGAVGTWEWHIPEDRMVAGPSFARTFGIDPEVAREGVPLDRFVSAIHKDDRGRVEQKIEDAIQSCGEYEAEYRVWNADDEIRWVVARGHVECDADGNPVTFPGTLTDITQRKENQRKIEESERRYRTLAENFPNGAVGLFDEDLQYTVVGGQLLDTLDLSPADRAGKSIYEIHSEEMLADIEPYFHAALEGETNSFEIEYNDRHLYAHTLPVRDGDDEVFAGMLVVQDVTERREAQRERRESEAKFRMLAENLEEIVWMATPDAEEFIYVNPAFEEVWGMDRTDLYDEPLSFLEAVHPDDRERVREGFAALPDSEFDDEFRIVRPDGEQRWIHARGTRVHDENGDMVRLVGVGEDVTERVERERKLEQSERRYRTLAENFPNGAVAVYDHDLRYTLTQGAVLGDILPSRDQLEGRTVPEVFPSHIVEDLGPQLQAAVEDGETSSATFEFGGRHWQVWATPLRDDDGDIFAGLSFTQDITEQVEREAELERALDLLEKSEQIADVGGWEINPKTQDVFWTDHVFDLLEVTGEEEPPLDEALDMYHEDDQSIVEDAVENALASGDPFDVKVRVRTDSGEIRWLRLQGVPETVDDEVVSFRGAAQDITEQVEREQRLEELVGDLEASNERLEQFAYAASHDLQEPLRMVSSYLQMIERRYGDVLDEDGQEFIDFAVDGAERMRDMIEGLLEYSRVETRGNPFEPVDLDSVLADVRDDLQVRVRESDAEIIAESLPRVDGDEGQLRQVFQNLVDNAIEYSGDEPPRIDISAERDRDEWTITVRDEGVGIDANDANRVFEVFESLHTPDDHSGTGIGLALCERIIERHGGDIWVESEPGEGATFSLTLPADGEHSE